MLDRRPLLHSRMPSDNWAVRSPAPGLSPQPLPGLIISYCNLYIQQSLLVISEGLAELRAAVPDLCCPMGIQLTIHKEADACLRPLRKPSALASGAPNHRSR